MTTVSLVETIAEMRQRVSEARHDGMTVGFVPTMGALHEGHGALIERARAETGFVVVSIFVNPIQFDRADDFDKYPRTLDTDLAFCDRLGVDAVFAPSAKEMYPQRSLTHVEVEQVSERLCGQFRPGHFRGVATVVAKLFNIVQSDYAYFGEKDAQQLAVLTRMTADLNFSCKVVPVATVRESDGLAKSSRNVRLTPEERRIAPAIYRALQAAANTVTHGADVTEARTAALSVLGKHPEFRLEYLEFVDPATMQPLEGGARIASSVRAVTAIWLGETRLIDNVLCVPHPAEPSGLTTTTV